MICALSASLTRLRGFRTQFRSNITSLSVTFLVQCGLRGRHLRSLACQIKGAPRHTARHSGSSSAPALVDCAGEATNGSVSQLQTRPGPEKLTHTLSHTPYKVFVADRPATGYGRNGRRHCLASRPGARNVNVRIFFASAQEYWPGLFDLLTARHGARA